MAVDVTEVRSRRTLLTAAAAAAAALVAQALGRPAPARAEDQNIKVGGEYYDALTLTYINNPTNSNTVFGVQSTAGGIALSGASDSNAGVRGFSTSSVGVWGESDSGRGVEGGSDSGFGVGGWSSTSAGVYGESDSGDGMYGFSETGAGVRAEADPSGTALRVDGKATFLRSGIASVAVGIRSTTVTTAFDLTPASQVHCTLDSNQAGLFLHRVTRNPAGDTFRITLSANVATGKYARVAWIVFG